MNASNTTHMIFPERIQINNLPGRMEVERWRWPDHVATHVSIRLDNGLQYSMHWGASHPYGNWLGQISAVNLLVELEDCLREVLFRMAKLPPESRLDNLDIMKTTLRNFEHKLSLRYDDFNQQHGKKA